jgi:hypothetical protein
MTPTTWKYAALNVNAKAEKPEMNPKFSTRLQAHPDSLGSWEAIFFKSFPGDSDASQVGNSCPRRLKLLCKGLF